MFNEATLDTAVNLGSALAREGIKLVPSNNSLISVLTAACTDKEGLIAYDGTFSSDMFIKDHVRGMASGNTHVRHDSRKEYNLSTHDSYMDNYVDDMVGLVSNYVNFTRGTVNKEVTKFKEELEGRLVSNKQKQPEEMFNVSYIRLNDVYTSPIMDEIKDYVQADSSSIASFYPSLSSVTMDEESVRRYLSTGLEHLDTGINVWLSSIGVGKCIAYLLGEVKEYAMSNMELLDYCLANYLFYKAVAEKEDISIGLSLVDTRSTAVANRKYYATRLDLALQMYYADIRRSKILVKPTSGFDYFTDKTIDVNIYEENFKKLVENGGNIELVFGYIASSNGKNNADVTVGDLISNTAMYLARWNSSRGLYLAHLNNNRLSTFKTLCKMCFDGYNIPSEGEELQQDKDVPLRNSKYLEETAKLVAAYIENLHVSDLDDLNLISLNIIAKYKYRYSNSYDILRKMYELLASDSKLTPMEASLYSVVDYLVEYLAEQVNVVKS